MKILYVTAKGGIHDYRFLKKMVNDYEVLMLHYAADKLIEEIKNIPGLRIISKKPMRKSFPLLSEFRHFKKIVKNFKPSIIHSGYVWQVGILPAIHNLHPHLSMVWGSDILIEPYKNLLIKKIVSRVMKQCDHIQCDAEFVKQRILNDYRVGSEKVTVFPWGIELDVFHQTNKTEARKKLNLDENKFIIIFNRNLEPVYGVNYMLDGFKKFSENNENAVLIIVSDGSLRNDVMKYISLNKLQYKVKLTGKVKNTEMADYLNAADVYISPSLSDGSSLSLLEAMACGLGIIVSDVPAIKEWISDQNGIIIPRASSEAVCTALMKYYVYKHLIELHGQKNIKIAKERADWNKNYLKLKEIYDKICSK